MAGSYRHVTDDDGTFRGIDLLDHMGDAYEALEEMHAMIRHLATVAGAYSRASERQIIDRTISYVRDLKSPLSKVEQEAKKRRLYKP